MKITRKMSYKQVIGDVDALAAAMGMASGAVRYDAEMGCGR